jgi:pseudaminic acid cytidylyltransferase
MTAIAIIPAKGHSSRIPRKNIREFHGRPIISYSIEAAKASGLFDMIVVSTDDEEIENAARYFGAIALARPFHLTLDDVGTQDVAADVLKRLAHYGHEFACCLYPTAPLIDVNDLKRAAELVKNSSMNYAFSVGTDPLCDAGQFYFGYTSAFTNNWPLFDALTYMVPVAANRVCDINVEEDFIRAEQMYAALHP